jgi:hypothetical protein
MESRKNKHHEKISYCRFNQGCTCLVIGTEANGFYIYCLNPLQLIFSSAEIDTVPMHCVCVEMNYVSSIMALVQTPAKKKISMGLKPLSIETSPPFGRIEDNNLHRRSSVVKPTSKKEVTIWDYLRKEGVYIFTVG